MSIALSRIPAEFPAGGTAISSEFGMPKLKQSKIDRHNIHSGSIPEWIRHTSNMTGPVAATPVSGGTISHQRVQIVEIAVTLSRKMAQGGRGACWILSFSGLYSFSFSA
jgi:hypothetical protein